MSTRARMPGPRGRCCTAGPARARSSVPRWRGKKRAGRARGPERESPSLNLVGLEKGAPGGPALNLTVHAWAAVACSPGPSPISHPPCLEDDLMAALT
jgi:hypothetical protein